VHSQLKGEDMTPRRIWANGKNGRVFIGHEESWAFLILAALDNGWNPQDSETGISDEGYPQTIGKNDALSMARILRKRLKVDNPSNCGAERLIQAFIALLMEGPVIIAPGKEPGDEHLFLSKTNHPPYRHLVHSQCN
jgi:hypothetical protein